MKSNYTSTGEMLDSLRAAMLHAIGYAPASIQITDKVERFDTAKRNDKAGWYVCHLTRWGMVARFGSWRECSTQRWSSFDESKLNRKDLAEFRAIQQAQARAKQAETDQRHEAARVKAIKMYGDSVPASHAHPYLIKKQIQAHGAMSLGELLLIPVHDLDGALYSLQTIAPGGAKKFLSGGRKKGLFFLIGESLNNKKGVIICEGFATGASLYEAYEMPVLVAFDANNLYSVALSYRGRYWSTPIIIAADDDRNKPTNTGLDAAHDVARKVPNTRVIAPPFPDHAPADLSDFNDLANYMNSIEVCV